jgi:hypothetical protein
LIRGHESYIIEIERDRVGPLMEVFNNDYRLLANHLKLMNDRMVLVNPRFALEEAHDQVN